MTEKHNDLLAARKKASDVVAWVVESMTGKMIDSCMVRAYLATALNSEREFLALMAEDHADAVESGTAKSDAASVCNDIAAGIRTRVKP